MKRDDRFSIRVDYLGRNKDYDTRFAVVSWTSMVNKSDPRQREFDNRALEHVYRMEDEGWAGWFCVDESAWFPMWDREEYDCFVKDWKKVKKEIREIRR